MDVNLERFHQTFFDESVEHLASMEAALLELEGRPDDDERLNAIFRGAHSIKGASGTFGFTDVAQFTHTLESLLDRLRHHQIVASAGLVDLLLRATDMLRLLIAAARQGGNAPAEAGTLQRELTQALGEEAAAGAQRPKESVPPSSQAPSQRDYDVTFVPNTDLLRLGADPLLVLSRCRMWARCREFRPTCLTCRTWSPWTRKVAIWRGRCACVPIRRPKRLLMSSTSSRITLRWLSQPPPMIGATYPIGIRAQKACGCMPSYWVRVRPFSSSSPSSPPRPSPVC